MLCAQRGINCTEHQKLADAEDDTTDHTPGNLTAEALINTAANTHWSTG